MKKKILFLTIISIIFILLASCASSGNTNSNNKSSTEKKDNRTDSCPMEGKIWELIRVERSGRTIELNRAQMIRMNFENMFTLTLSNTNVSGRAAPNNYAGQIISMDGSKIAFSQFISTKMAIIGDINLPLNEDEYFHLLQKTSEWEIKGNNLILHTVDSANAKIRLVYSLR